ncbi:MAG TPA: ATP-binding protein, partial [Burkholderiales bacterium]|nr:ATP-binding protein [Burkholderiales bacterium]
KTTAGSRVALGVHVAPDTPAVEVDPNELEMALINLVANARDALERTGHIEVLARAEAGYAVISVSDSGQGIAPEVAARVFEPFFTTKPAGSGTGLGLSQVYGFCRQAGGEARIESDPGVGTTVSLYLPARQPAAQAAPAAPSRPETRAARECAPRTAAAR